MKVGRFRVKWYLAVLGILGLAMIVTGATIALSQGDALKLWPAYSEQEVISIIKVYGVPEVNDYLSTIGQPRIYGIANPVGDWAAVYEGDGRWRIQGSIAIQCPECEYESGYGSSTWTYLESYNEINLLSFTCDPSFNRGQKTRTYPETPTTTPTRPGGIPVYPGLPSLR